MDPVITDGQRVAPDAVSAIEYEVLTHCLKMRRERVRGVQVGRWAVSGGWPLVGRPTQFSDGLVVTLTENVAWVAHAQSGFIVLVEDGEKAFKTCVAVADVISAYGEDIESDDWREVDRRVRAGKVWAWLMYCNRAEKFVDYRRWLRRRRT